MDIISFLKMIAKVNLTDAEIDQLYKDIDKVGEKEYAILERHKINLLFFKHCKRINKVVELNKNKMLQYSNQLFVLQLLYKEYLEEAKKILCVLESQNIHYAVLKGFSFSQDLYFENEVLYRPFADIDILVNSKDCEKIKAVLTQNSFIQGKINNDKIIPFNRSEIIYWTLNSHQLPEFVKFSKYANISSRYWIEMDFNTTIFEGGKKALPIPTDFVLNQTKKLFSIYNDQLYYTLSPTYGLLQLCYHFYKDTIYETKKIDRADYSLMKFCDIREFIYRYREQIDWGEFLNVINNANIGNQIYYSLWLVSTFYGDLNIQNILDNINITEDFSKNNLDWEGMLL